MHSLAQPPSPQKTRGNETYHAVLSELAPLRKRDWLTKWNGTHVIPGAL